VSSAQSASPAPPTDLSESAPLLALIGPPNSGKSTLFNTLTGLRQKVANFPGVTVEKRLGSVDLDDGRTIELVDLPGVDGFSARTADQRITRDVLEGRVPGLRAPDGIIVIVDSTRLEQHLMMVEPILELGLPTLLVLNMSDEFEVRGGQIDALALGEAMGVTAIRATARAGEGLEPIRAFLSSVVGQGAIPPRACPVVSNIPHGTPLPMVEAFSARRAWIRSATARAGFVAPAPSRTSRRLDQIFLHRIAGPLVFLAVIVLVFQAIFTWAVPMMDGVEALVATTGQWVGGYLPESWFRSLLIDGVWAGVGAVVVFLPQILILFLFLGILEDSGYMARAAVIADRLMYRAGLQGRAFLPLLSAYACAVPAILSARTVEDERDRLATIFVAPFMTCSARLPVYALLIAAFIPERPLIGPFFGARAATLLGLYGLGLAAAIGTTFLLRRTLLKGEGGSFMMELPPYRLPSIRSLALRLLDRSRVFLRRVGRVILAVSVGLWILSQFPAGPDGPPPIGDSALGWVGHTIEPVIKPLGFDWRIGIGLVSSLAAREVIVGTMGTIYGIENPEDETFALQEALKRDLTFGSAVGLLIFFVFALQCMSTVAVMRRETGGWRWPALQFGYMLTLAYVGAFLAYRIL